MRATIIVLGDLARSPRTVLHARALAGTGAEVDLVGFAEPGWRPPGAPATVHVRPIASHVAPDAGDAVARTSVWSTIARGLRLGASLTRTLFWTLPSPDVVLVQNPPGVPVLALAWLAARTRGARLAIDWHNLTWSMLGLRLGDGHPLVRAVSAYERVLGRRADVNLFVSEQMARALAARWGIRGSVFRDRSAAVFKPLPPRERDEIRGRLLRQLGEPDLIDTAIVVTATSWTADEDFEVLLDALRVFDARRQATPGPDGRAPRTVMLMTGRGPLREEFERRVAGIPLATVGVHTAWLEADEYPRVLAAADLGVCVHRSASGLDLPMKVLDMFGAGIPVCALDYGACLSELVQDGVNGLLFRTGAELAGHMSTLLVGTPADNQVLRRLRAGVVHAQSVTWQQGWTQDVLPLLR